MAEAGIKRNESLDYLRGLAACGVMAYHMNMLSFGESDASTVIAKLKIFAVSIFYVLSGLTLYLANGKLTPTAKSLKIFYIKRFFRIFPLMWLATLLTYILNPIPIMFTVKDLIINATIIPGMLRSDHFAANGAWSIGNELFFYVFFPFLVFLYRSKKLLFALAQVIIFAAFLFFTFRVMSPTTPLGAQWSLYVNPFNQFFYFAIGIYLATLPRAAVWLARVAPVLILAFAAAILLYPITGEPVVLVTGVTRVVISFLVITLCYLFYISDLDFLPGFLKYFLKYLGDTSYAIYLMHPLVFIVVKFFSDRYLHLNPYAVIGIAVVLSLLLAKLVYEKYERYFMKKGQQIIAKY